MPTGPHGTKPMPSSSHVARTPFRFRVSLHDASIRVCTAVDRLHGVRPADGSCARLGEAEVQHLALADQLLDRARHVFDRHVGIDAVLIESSMRSVRRRFSDSSTTFLMCSGRLLRPPGFDVEAELGRDHDLVAERRERFADELFVGVGAVDFGGVEERDALFIGGADDLDALVSAARAGRSWR